jgi:hypothetical protein
MKCNSLRVMKMMKDKLIPLRLNELSDRLLVARGVSLNLYLRNPCHT